MAYKTIDVHIERATRPEGYDEFSLGPENTPYYGKPWQQEPVEESVVCYVSRDVNTEDEIVEKRQLDHKYNLQEHPMSPGNYNPFHVESFDGLVSEEEECVDMGEGDMVMRIGRKFFFLDLRDTVEFYMPKKIVPLYSKELIELSRDYTQYGFLDDETSSGFYNYSSWPSGSGDLLKRLRVFYSEPNLRIHYSNFLRSWGYATHYFGFDSICYPKERILYPALGTFAVLLAMISAISPGRVSYNKFREYVENVKRRVSGYDILEENYYDICDHLSHDIIVEVEAVFPRGTLHHFMAGLFRDHYSYPATAQFESGSVYPEPASLFFTEEDPPEEILEDNPPEETPGDNTPEGEDEAHNRHACWYPPCTDTSGDASAARR